MLAGMELVSIPARPLEKPLMASFFKIFYLLIDNTQNDIFLSIYTIIFGRIQGLDGTKTIRLGQHSVSARGDLISHEMA